MYQTPTRGMAADIRVAAFRPIRCLQRLLLPAALASLLAACGGGGGGGDGGGAGGPAVAGPPATGAALANSSDEAALSAQAVVAGGDAAVARSGSLSGVSAVFGSPVAVHPSPAASRKRALAVIDTPCNDWVDLPCFGSAVVDTNLTAGTKVVNPGHYIDVRFTNVSGTLLGDSLSMNGRMRIDFQSTFVLDATQLPGLNVRLTLDGFGGSVNGKSFGPVTDLAQLQFDNLGVGSLTSAGARYTGLSGVTTTGPGDYLVAGTTVRKGYWADASRYVDLALSNWRVAGGRPVPGSSADVTGPQDIVSILVASSSAETVVYRVSIFAGNNPTTGQYIVTASYPSGGGAPTYTAVPGTL